MDSGGTVFNLGLAAWPGFRQREVLARQNSGPLFGWIFGKGKHQPTKSRQHKSTGQMMQQANAVTGQSHRPACFWSSKGGSLGQIPPTGTAIHIRPRIAGCSPARLDVALHVCLWGRQAELDEPNLRVLQSHLAVGQK